MSSTNHKVALDNNYCQGLISPRQQVTVQARRFMIGAVLIAEDGVIRVGDRTVVMENTPREATEYLAARGLDRPQLRVGADRIARYPGLRRRGPGRLVRYNDPSDADCLPEAVADLDDNREPCGDLPG
jgi:hypothetical protein